MISNQILADKQPNPIEVSTRGIKWEPESAILEIN
jgi:hypothetical protein